jgi:hypothetical protein
VARLACPALPCPVFPMRRPASCQCKTQKNALRSPTRFDVSPCPCPMPALQFFPIQHFARLSSHIQSDSCHCRAGQDGEVTHERDAQSPRALARATQCQSRCCSPAALPTVCPPFVLPSKPCSPARPSPLCLVEFPNCITRPVRSSRAHNKYHSRPKAREFHPKCPPVTTLFQTHTTTTTR